MDDCLRLNFKGAHQVIESVLEELEAGQVFKVAEVLALIGIAPAGEREHALEMAADRQ